MRTLVEINGFLFLVSVAILYFVLRYRVHIHLEYTPRGMRTRCRRNPHKQSSPVVSGKGRAGEISGEVNPAILKDLQSALVNLGATKEEAQARASAAIAQGPGDFDALILRAMQYTDGKRRK